MKAIDEARAFAEACEEYSTGAVDAFHRQAFHKAAEVINMLCEKLSTNGVINRAKQEEKGKERSKEKGKEAPPPPARVRARVSDAFLEKWKIPALFVKYWLEVTGDREIKDTERSLRNWWTHADRDKAWFQFKRNHEEAAKLAAKVYPPADWALCRERCAHCDERGCTVGCKVPPDRDPQRPYRPEDCGHYSSVTKGKAK